MKYRCCFPNCEYGTDDRTLIEFHHVNPRELGNVLNHNVTVPLCPLHHKLIYHPAAVNGQHSRKHPESMTIVQVAMTNTGSCVIFEDMSGKEITVTIDKRDSTDIMLIEWTIVHGITESIPDDIDEYICQLVYSKGYHADGNRVYYTKSYRTVANDLLRDYIAQYMLKVTHEHEKALAKARSDYRSLKKYSAG